MIPPKINVVRFPPLTEGCSESVDASRFFSKHDIRLEDTSSHHLLLINFGERTSTSPLALGYDPLGSSRHVRAHYCMP